MRLLQSHVCNRRAVFVGVLVLHWSLLQAGFCADATSTDGDPSASITIGGFEQRVYQGVKNLEYSDQVADDFVAMVRPWKCELLQEKLAQAADDAKQEKISWADYEQIEQEVAAQLAQRITTSIEFLRTSTIQSDMKRYFRYFDLAVVVKEKKTYCLGYAEIFFILGNATGLTVRGILIGAHADSQPRAGVGHNANLVKLHEGKVVQADLTFKEPISKAFVFKDAYTKAGAYWELKDKQNPLHLHRKIQVQYAKEMVAAICMMQGCHDRRSGKLAEAIAKQTRAIELNPNFPEPYINRASAYFDTGKFPAAIADCNQAIQLNALFPNSYYWRAKAYTRTGKTDLALSDYSKAIEFDPKYVDAYLGRGMVYFDSNEFTKSIADFTKCIETDPKSDTAYLKRGNAYFKTGKHERAIADFSKVIELKPKDSGAYIWRGSVYGELRRFAEAIDDCSKAIALDPKSSLAYYNRGTALAFTGRKQEAARDLRKALELDPKLRPDVDKTASRFALDL